MAGVPDGVTWDVVAGAADVVGFKVAAISLVIPSGDVEVVAVAGDDDARAEIMGRRTARINLEAEFAAAERWGSLRFVPAGHLPDGAADGWVASDWSPPTPRTPSSRPSPTRSATCSASCRWTCP